MSLEHNFEFLQRPKECLSITKNIFKISQQCLFNTLKRGK